jgi:hypothetical protein
MTQMIPIPEDVRQMSGQSFEEIVAMCEGQPALEDFIRELEQKHGS